MIKFFRHIRKRLLSEGKTSKYFKYAIGEIILVVIGILIALQINNWNEDRKDRKLEIEFLIGLQKTLRLDLDRNLKSQKINQEALNSMNFLIEHLEHNRPYHDSIKYHFGAMSQFQFWDLSESVFESLKAKGLDLISNKNLRDSLALAYGNHNKSINYAGFRYYDNIDHAIFNIFNKRFKKAWAGSDEDRTVFDVDVNVYMEPLNYEALKTDQEFLYFLKTLPNLQHYKIRGPLKETQKLLERLLILIDDELKK
ncbi:MAG: hypothetical protein CMB99_02100 [Flavobacteriaceae bacterium]|nr:hypothetical protein [Flavobacteriaceae bacterium]|tara:strand:- start:61063 stop:61824 length:762 start_codon:yes stop_codon:yes gene_type:complete